jgi:hypothetical protein
MRPASKEDAPDPARSYERAKPEKESGMGRLDNNKATPARVPDRQEQTVTHRQEPRQINAHDETQQRAQGQSPQGQQQDQSAPNQPDHSMKDEEPLGWDQAPTDISNPRNQRHPRRDGKGGTP